MPKVLNTVRADFARCSIVAATRADNTAMLMIENMIIADDCCIRLPLDKAEEFATSLLDIIRLARSRKSKKAPS